MIKYIPDEIISYIFSFLDIKCHTCFRDININFWKKQGNFYYCCKNCYLYF